MCNYGYSLVLNLLYIFFLSVVQKCLKNHLVNIIKKERKAQKEARKRYQNLSHEEREKRQGK